MPTIHNGDCIETMKAMPPESVDAIVCDPPYGLSNTTPAQVADTITKWAGGDRGHVPTGRGFMGKSWDAFVPPPAVWDECLRVLKPGGHMVVFAGSRTHDLMGLSIRLAGFEMRDSLAWLYGSGFPKSHDVSKGIDKLAGAEREIVGPYIRRGDSKPYAVNSSASVEFNNASTKGDITAPATPEAAQWDGWGTALKPAFEPIVLARKPLAEKTVARNVLAHGTGAINVDATRIPTEDKLNGGGATTPVSEGWDRPFRHDPKSIERLKGETAKKVEKAEALGRWPANVLLDQHAAGWVDEQSGTLASRGNKSPEKTGGGGGGYTVGMGREFIREVPLTYEDAGGASRFFYVAKAPKSERPNVDGVQHPTVKPLAIMRWLIRLVTPPGGTVLDPFAGSGTTIEAALIEGFNPVGIEMEPDYLPLIQHRIDRQAGTLTA